MSNPVIKSPYPQILTGTTAPTMTPSFIGQQYLDTTAKREYKAYGTSSSADWEETYFPFSYIRMKSIASKGSTNTNIVIYGTKIESSGGDITYTTSSTNGDIFTINTSGIYSISTGFNFTSRYAIGGVYSHAIVDNTIGGDKLLIFTSQVFDATGGVSSGSWVGYIPSGNKIWIATSGTIGNLSPERNSITIVRVK